MAPSTSSIVELQSTSFDIWQTKYQLTAKDGSKVDKNIDDTYIRLARALSDVEAEPNRQKYFDEFLWALRNGAIPAGRIVSNAGANRINRRPRLLIVRFQVLCLILWMIF